MVCPVSPEQWQQRAEQLQTAQVTRTTRETGVLPIRLGLAGTTNRMHVLGPKRQTWGHVSHGRHRAAPDGVPAGLNNHGGGLIGRRRPWMMDHAAARSEISRVWWNGW